MPSIPILLEIRAILSTALVFILFLRTMAFFMSHKNGLTRAMATELFMATCYVGVVVFISFVDVAPLPMLPVRQRMLLVWNIIHLLWILAAVWLTWKWIIDG